MAEQLRYVTPLSQCPYLPDRLWRLEYVLRPGLSAAGYGELLNEGWRRTGFLTFRPRCPSCTACQSIRVTTDQFRPNRSQRRTAKLNAGLIHLEFGPPTPSDEEKVDLYVRHHGHHSSTKGWPTTTDYDAFMHLNNLSESPFGVQEWRYYLQGKLVGMVYVDAVPDGLSGVYYFFDPDYRNHSLGTWAVLTMIERARELHLPYVYLGYYVEGCRSMEYKARFRPNQILGPDGQWHDFRS
jgi:arginine-tRNA-protein transferase